MNKLDELKLIETLTVGDLIKTLIDLDVPYDMPIMAVWEGQSIPIIGNNISKEVFEGRNIIGMDVDDYQ